MQEPQDLIYYVHEDKVKDQVKDEDYEQHAINYKVKGYKKEQKQLKTNGIFQATIDLNEELVKKLKINCLIKSQMIRKILKTRLIATSKKLKHRKRN